MVVRAVEGKKPYTGGIAIEITEDKVINLRLRDENNLIQYDEGDNEIYVDLQLDDEIEPTDELPVGITTGRIIVDNQRDYTGTILVAKTTSGDLIKFVYADNGNIYIDNGTGTFKQIYLKADVDTLINALRVEIKNYVDAHDTVVSATEPTEPYKGQLWYDTANDKLKAYDGTQWNIVDSNTTYTAGNNIQISNANVISATDTTYSAGTGIDITSDVISIDSTVVATQTDLSSKQDSLTASTGISIDSNNNISNTLPGATVDSTAPSNPSQGDQWYDTTNDVLKIYDGTQWNEVGGSSSGAAWGQITGTLSDQTDLQNALDAKQDILTAGNGITISSANRTRSASTLNISVDTAVVATQTEMADKQDMLTAGDNITIEQVGVFESDMKGPCPSGFHVPLKAEWTAVRNAISGLGLSVSRGREASRYLKLPYAGKRKDSNGAVESQGSNSMYWMAEDYNGEQALALNLQAYSFSDSTIDYHAMGCSIRAFKNTAVAPTSSWTVLYDGSGVAAGAGVFHNETDGIISISSDGSTWTTIADKNVGATRVFNYGDSLSQANCGNYFQWGNNYGFPWTGSVTTSTTKVDASTYGPGNYYSSSTFIKAGSSPYRWENPNNPNLRGGNTQGTWSDGYDTVISAVQSGTVESDMKGPCSSGYHVPSIREWNNVLNAGVTLGAWTLASSGVTNLVTYLHIPYSGGRYGTNGNFGFMGTLVNYWSSVAQGQNGYRVLIDPSNGVNSTSTECITFGFPVRPFKNEPSIPDVSWTTVFAGTGSAGIFYNATLGAISISADGTTWYTIADKDLGQTVVWSYGDTLDTTNYTNVGKLYQWGNNHGFTYNEAGITSTSQQDASGYGPGQYYDSSTFVIRSTNSNWSFIENNNLWGGITQRTRLDTSV